MRVYFFNVTRGIISILFLVLAASALYWRAV